MSTLPPPLPLTLNNVNLSGDGFGYGFTAGVTFTPTPTTQIGLGWRSAINQKLEGDLTVPLPIIPISTPGPIEATVKLPDTVSLGIRQRIGPAFTLLGTVEWTNWSRIGTTPIERAGGAPALVAGTPVRLPFEYQDGWFYAIGAEYSLLPTLTLRAGLGYETSPITDRERTPRIPDADRTWVSVGASYQVTPKLSFDLAYTHVFVDTANVNISAASGNPWFTGATYIGTAESKLDILSFGIRYRWFDPPAPPLVTKG
jgi:long-chain fatty acid transport protein